MPTLSRGHGTQAPQTKMAPGFLSGAIQQVHQTDCRGTQQPHAPTPQGLVYGRDAGHRPAAGVRDLFLQVIDFAHALWLDGEARLLLGEIDLDRIGLYAR